MYTLFVDFRCKIKLWFKFLKNIKIFCETPGRFRNINDFIRKKYKQAHGTRKM